MQFQQPPFPWRSVIVQPCESRNRKNPLSSLASSHLPSPPLSFLSSWRAVDKRVGGEWKEPVRLFWTNRRDSSLGPAEFSLVLTCHRQEQEAGWTRRTPWVILTVQVIELATHRGNLVENKSRYSLTASLLAPRLSDGLSDRGMREILKRYIGSETKTDALWPHWHIPHWHTPSPRCPPAVSPQFLLPTKCPWARAACPGVC